ncbi:hypothetical protein L1285_14835 [Pseudoalteromonas sp. DL2-H2.2]|uniref:hypothetical protein n=1 Tax=Pseudoalteromonas sp. DL2-H2.2 TaxID=2908889 RepID=UPI001F44252D|nr:hypothetical protein [Pseudoalteromonas sp. DL2-H2.2]MCF2909599.1 hypothetical protein [Pseudoalteromonas sp. DL2-H2.2]
MWVFIFGFPFLFYNVEDYPIVEREVLYDSYELTGSRIDSILYGYVNGKKSEWTVARGEVWYLNRLKKGQVVKIKSEMCNEKNYCGEVLSLYDGSNFLIKRESEEY